jgi:hypothetical protein
MLGPKLPTILDVYKMHCSPQHDALSLSTKLEDPSIAKLDLYVPQQGLCMIFEGP